MLAIDEKATDYIFSPTTDKIAFLSTIIELPKDSILNENLILFKEETPFTFKKARETTKGRILFGYTGRQENMKVNLLSNVPDGFKSAIEFEKETDTLNYWYTPIEGIDSLNFTVTHKDVIDSITVKLRKKKLDSLTISSNIRGTLKPLDTFFINTNNPIDSISPDKTKFSLISDSIPVNYEIKREGVRSLALFFEKEQNKNYEFTVLPDAIFDLYKVSNDSLNYFFNTKSYEDYGTIELNLENENKHNLIIELLDNNKVVQTTYSNNNTPVKFNLLEPKTYKIRVVIDTNKNNRWDTGNFLNKVYPEEIIYLDKDLELRPNWSLNETIIIE